MAATGNISEAVRKTKIGRTTVYEWRDEDVNFAAAWEAALNEYADKLEKEADRRAVDGWDEPVFYEGEVCGHKRKFSDTLLIFRLKALRPEKYRERISTEVSGPGILKVYLGDPVKDNTTEGVDLGKNPDS